MPKATHFSRRELCLMLPALAASSALAAEKPVLPSKVYHFTDLPVEKDGPLTMRPVFEGYTRDGFRIAMHESDLAPGGMPHPPHHHRHEEMFMLRQGELEVTIEGKSSRVGPGSVVYVASNQEHGARNVGTTHAQYFVVELGSDK
jgi:mannose-6-phosphate isomerase-like protein (cupin superfamily)